MAARHEKKKQKFYRHVYRLLFMNMIEFFFICFLDLNIHFFFVYVTSTSISTQVSVTMSNESHPSPTGSSSSSLFGKNIYLFILFRVCLVVELNMHITLCFRLRCCCCCRLFCCSSLSLNIGLDFCQISFVR